MIKYSSMRHLAARLDWYLFICWRLKVKTDIRIENKTPQGSFVADSVAPQLIWCLKADFDNIYTKKIAHSANLHRCNLHMGAPYIFKMMTTLKGSFIVQKVPLFVQKLVTHVIEVRIDNKSFIRINQKFIPLSSHK